MNERKNIKKTIVKILKTQQKMQLNIALLLLLVLLLLQATNHIVVNIIIIFVVFVIVVVFVVVFVVVVVTVVAVVVVVSSDKAPTQRRYRSQFVLKFDRSTKRQILVCEGEGVEARLEVLNPRMDFCPLMPGS